MFPAMLTLGDMAVAVDHGPVVFPFPTGEFLGSGLGVDGLNGDLVFDPLDVDLSRFPVDLKHVPFNFVVFGDDLI